MAFAKGQHGVETSKDWPWVKSVVFSVVVWHWCGAWYSGADRVYGVAERVVCCWRAPRRVSTVLGCGSDVRWRRPLVFVVESAAAWIACGSSSVSEGGGPRDLSRHCRSVRALGLGLPAAGSLLWRSARRRMTLQVGVCMFELFIWLFNQCYYLDMYVMFPLLFRDVCCFILLYRCMLCFNFVI